MAEYESFVSSSGVGDGQTSHNEFRFDSMPLQERTGAGLRDRWSSWTGLGGGAPRRDPEGGGKERQLAQVGNLDIIKEVPKRISNMNWGERLWGPSLDLNQLIMREDWALAAMQCKMRPHLAGRWLERSGFFMGRHAASVLPLHQAVALRPPVEMIQTLVITHPAGIKAKETSFGRIPLHVACRSGASAEAVECLLAYYPDGAQENDTLKRIPLHYALKNDAGEAVVDLLLDAYPDGVDRADHRGWIPLHVACSVGANLHIIDKIVEENPETLLVKTHKGSDPIKCAEMSKGHPNEAAIIAYLKEKIAKLKGDGRDEDDDSGDEDDKSQGNESHHEDDDLIDLGEGGGEERETVVETDLIGLGNSDDRNGEEARNDEGDEKKEAMLLDLDDGTENRTSVAENTDTSTNPPAEAEAGNDSPTAHSRGDLLGLGDLQTQAENNAQNGQGHNETGGDTSSPEVSEATSGESEDDDDSEEGDDDDAKGEGGEGGQDLIDLDGAALTESKGEDQDLIDLDGAARSGSKGEDQDSIDLDRSARTGSKGEENLIELGE